MRPEPSWFRRMNSGGTSSLPGIGGRGELCTYSNHGPSAESEPVGLLVGVIFSGKRVGAMVVDGRGDTVGIGTAVSAGETTVTAGAHEVKISAMSKMVWMFLTFIDTFLYKNGSMVCAFQGVRCSSVPGSVTASPVSEISVP